MYFFLLNGGLGSRVLQSAFIPSLIRLRKQQKLESSPILIADNSIISSMIANSFSDQNVHALNFPETPNQFPHHPGYLNVDGQQENPAWVDSWRDGFKTYGDQGNNLHDLLDNNWDRAFSIDYSFSLTRKIHQNKYKFIKESFIAYHFGKNMGLEYGGNVPALKITQYNDQITNLINNFSKPYIILHLGMDLNSGDMMAPLNYRSFKVWSLQRWQELVDSLKHKYQFLQIFANQFNPELKDVLSIKVDNLNPVLQLLEHHNCKFFMSADNFLPHLAASIKKPGIVQWYGGGSPAIWAWNQQYHKVPHFHVYNLHSCDTNFCWRPGNFDIANSGQSWICEKGYQCAKSVQVDQMLREVEKVEDWIENNKITNKISL